MAVKTMSASTGGGGLYSEGWHQLTIAKAEYGTWKGPDASKKYIDLWFNDYPDNMNLRVYEVTNKETGEEFRISNLFKYANAGIMAVLKDPSGKKPVIQYDDEATGLVGKDINVYMYKEDKSGNKWSRFFDNVAPVEQEGEHLSYTADQVAGIKKGVESSLQRVTSNTPSNGAFATTETSNTDGDDLPF